jgi:hypothetical protein
MSSRSVDLDPKQKDSTVLRFVQEAVQKGSSGAGLNEASPQVLVETGAVLGRRKLQSGKNRAGGPTVEWLARRPRAGYYGSIQ